MAHSVDKTRQDSGLAAGFIYENAFAAVEANLLGTYRCPLSLI